MRRTKEASRPGFLPPTSGHPENRLRPRRPLYGFRFSSSSNNDAEGSAAGRDKSWKPGSLIVSQAPFGRLHMRKWPLMSVWVVARVTPTLSSAQTVARATGIRPFEVASMTTPDRTGSVRLRCAAGERRPRGSPERRARHRPRRCRSLPLKQHKAGGSLA
jgi:hypothetical protein